ncbi:hypothetical protein GCM10012279_34170 [Micromonospora yangpuensis]|nr:hypothetical protein GCM10012279_34170 [Micromonospora yangpuensis]
MPERAPAVLRSPVHGTMQIDLDHGEQTEHWQVVLAPGKAEVRRGQTESDTTWFCSADLFERLVTGERQSIAAMLRSETTIVGNVVLFLAFRGFFPSPPGTRDPRDTARELRDREQRASSGGRDR